MKLKGLTGHSPASPGPGRGASAPAAYPAQYQRSHPSLLGVSVKGNPPRT